MARASTAKHTKKVISYAKLTDYFFNAGTLSWFSGEGIRLTRTLLSLRVANGTACYTEYDKYRSTNAVTLGKQFYSKVVKGVASKDEILSKDIKRTYKELSATNKAVFYHEVAHVMYTDMKTFTTFITKLQDKGYPDFATTFKVLFNIIEDICIEEDLAFFYPSIGKFLKYLRLSIFDQDKVDAFQKKMDDKSIDDLINFILYRYRMPAHVKFEHGLYTDNKKDIHGSMYACTKTSDATRRVERALAFAWEFSQLFLTSAATFDIKAVVAGKDEAWIDSLPTIPTPKPLLSSGTGKLDPTASGSSKGGGTTPTTSTSPGKGADSDVDAGTAATIDGEIDGGKAGHSPSLASKPLKEADSSMDPDKGSVSDGIIRQAANDEPLINHSHRSMLFNDYYDASKHKKHYDDMVRKSEDKINKLVSVIKKLKAVNNNRYERHQRRGKLDKRKITKPIVNAKLFKNKIAPRKEADLAFSILVDNSGSMMGRKSLIVGEALIIIQETLNRLKIPFEVNAFTEDYDAVTIEMKRFNDSFTHTKYNSVLFTKQLRITELATFMGNVDESNLDFVGRRFLEERKEKDKILIVMSDGATCGSAKVLSSVSENFTRKGITMLGIGVIDDNVENIYTDHEVFSTVQDLERLAPVIQKYILNKVFK